MFLLVATISLLAELAVRHALSSLLGARIVDPPQIQLEFIEETLSSGDRPNHRLVILGDSTATYSLDASSLPDTISLAAANSTSIESYFIFKRYAELGHSPRCALISFSATWSAHRDERWKLFSTNEFYSDRDMEEILDVMEKERELGSFPGRALFRARLWWNKLGFFNSYEWKRIHTALLSPTDSALRSEKIRKNIRQHSGSKLLDRTQNFGGPSSLRHRELPNLTASERHYYHKLLALLRSRQVEIFVLIVPLPMELTSHAADRKHRVTWMAELNALEFPVQFISPPNLPASYFLSAGHLNAKGIAEISPILRTSLRRCFR